ncbi:hypothetical protein BC834DRAFT_866249 [Gloeopeniophorella convolvens]|nr:hypothetical protein BC834DRAFT_866249 [Gloeopeniophorella convolvens]
MPFANLSPHEKDAFFALLDEYFASRPDILPRAGGGPGAHGAAPPQVPQAAVAAAQRAFANPAATRALAAGFQRAATSAGAPASVAALAAPSFAAAAPSLAAAAVTTTASASPTPPPAPAPRSMPPPPGARSMPPPPAPRRRDPTPPSPPPGPDHELNPEPEPEPALSVRGRVAAAAQQFSAPPPPRAAHMPAHKAADTGEGRGLVVQKKFGDVDVSSTTGMLRSLRGSTAAKHAVPPTVRTPSAFERKKSAFAPPPVRRASSSVSPAPEPEPEPEAQEEEAAAAGEWAEALYDFASEEASDLPLQAGQHVLVTERTSDDWWTGEANGRSGLFPATYVKVL